MDMENFMEYHAFFLGEMTMNAGHSFFFQAEVGIRDHCVTGVQTCALPIYRVGDAAPVGRHLVGVEPLALVAHEPGELVRLDRSEERRVGKECRSRWSP